MKNIIIKIFSIIVFIVILVNSTETRAVPAVPELVTISQIDNSKVDVYIKGDETFHWFESLEQFTLLENIDGYIVYATKNVNGDLVPSQYRYWNDNVKIKQTKDRADFVNNLQKKLFFSKKQIDGFISNNKPSFNDKSELNNKDTDKLQQYSTTLIEGSRKYLVVLVQYTDLSFTKSKEDFDRLFNEIGYTYDGYGGSVKDFYVQNSYGKFSPEFVVIGPYQTNYNMEYYKSNTKELALEVATFAYYELGSLADFDNDNDNYVDAISIIFAGWGEEAGFQKGIWSHASQIMDTNGYSPMLGSKYIRRYCCSPELRGNRDSNITAIGVSAHEFCHTLGAPDYYDIDYDANGYYQGAGAWCLMASGSWNCDGDCPANINIFQKWMYGWVTPIGLTTQDVSVNNMPNSAYNSVAYRIDTDTPDEFYIMENRQRVGFDEYIPGHGLLIWHIHSDLSILLSYGLNGVNSTHPQLMYPVCASSTNAMPNNASDSYGVINSVGTPFPGSSNNTEFTDKSVPASCSWNGKYINRPIKNITEIDTFISFDYKGRPASIFTIPYFYNFTNTSTFTNDYYPVGPENSSIGWKRLQENTGNYVAEFRSFYSLDTSHQKHYLFLPPFQLYSNYLYSFSVKYKVYSAIYSGNMKLYICNARDTNDKILIKDFGDELGATAFTPLSTDFSVDNDGIYYIAICSYSKGDYMQLFIDDIDIKGMVGIRDVSDRITIFPNSVVENTINIVNSSDENIKSVEIFDLAGKMLLKIEDNNTIDISNLNIGTYVVRITTHNKSMLNYVITKILGN